GVLELIKDNKIDYKEIKNIHLRMAPLAKNQGVNYKPDSILASRLSIPCCLSIAARKGRVTLKDFNKDLLKETEHLKFMQKVTVEPDEHLNKEYPKSRFAGEVTITTIDD